jgi:nucleotide-binding universal stress UspA family protein
MAKIVVGVDGSDASKDALRWAVEEAKLRRAEVAAVHACRQ